VRNASRYESTHHLTTTVNFSRSVDRSTGNSPSIVLGIHTESTNEFYTFIDGNTNDVWLYELSGGARISFVFHEFKVGVKSIDPFDQVKGGDIRTILYNSLVRAVFLCCCPVLMRRVRGLTPGLFVGTAAFVIVKQ
jgi:hypothetical protein